MGLLRNVMKTFKTKYLVYPRPHFCCFFEHHRQKFWGKAELLPVLYWFNLVCLGSHLKLVLMFKLLSFRNCWLLCLKLCNGKSWWVPSWFLWFVKFSVNTVERVVDPLTSLYIQCVYGACLTSALRTPAIHLLNLGSWSRISSSSQNLALSGFSLVNVALCIIRVFAVLQERWFCEYLLCHCLSWTFFDVELVGF